jgi:conjugative transfer signal peptidase TraF
MPRVRDLAVILVVWVSAFSALALMISQVRLNVSASAPLGFYRRQAMTTLTSGLLVAVPVPEAWQPVALTHGVIPNRQTLLLKPVAALPGTEVCLRDEDLRIHGVSYGPILEGFSPAFRGCLTVPPGEVFLASGVPGSFDSRYFGSVPVGQIDGQMTPLWTWE